LPNVTGPASVIGLKSDQAFALPGNADTGQRPFDVRKSGCDTFAIDADQRGCWSRVDTSGGVKKSSRIGERKLSHAGFFVGVGRIDRLHHVRKQRHRISCHFHPRRVKRNGKQRGVAQKHQMPGRRVPGIRCIGQLRHALLRLDVERIHMRFFPLIPGDLRKQDGLSIRKNRGGILDLARQILR
jgi:hypothetical protein